MLEMVAFRGPLAGLASKPPDRRTLFSVDHVKSETMHTRARGTGSALSIVSVQGSVRGIVPSRVPARLLGIFQNGPY